MCARPGPSQGQPPWIAYSLRDIQTARAGQHPSQCYLGVCGSALKTRGKIFQPVRHGPEALGKVASKLVGLVRALRGLRFVQFVGHEQRGEKQHPRFALPRHVAHGGELVVDDMAKVGNVRFLAIGTSDGEAPSADLKRDVAQGW